jgi:hypothetical protein
VIANKKPEGWSAIPTYSVGTGFRFYCADCTTRLFNLALHFYEAAKDEHIHFYSVLVQARKAQA